MKKLSVILLFLLSYPLFSQKSAEYLLYIEELSENNIEDKTDTTVLNLLNDVYEEILQAESAELHMELGERIMKIYEDPNSKNIFILNMFLAYQDYISNTVLQGIQPDSSFQVNITTDLANEINELYGEIPAIVLIYRAEALLSDNQTEEYSQWVSESLSKYPNSIPLKVYKYIDTEDEKLREDLVKNHSNHWLVKEYEIE